MGKTKIEWSEFSVNPLRASRQVLGLDGLSIDHVSKGHYCEKISPGCANCYASRMQPRFGMPTFDKADLQYVELYLDEKVLQSVLRRRKPTTYFWCDMTDMFGEWVPDEWIDQCLAVVALTPQHTHQWLTKRPERMQGYFERGEESLLASIGKSWAELPSTLVREPTALSGWPMKNLWLGVSAENQQYADERIPHLLKCPAAVRFVSYEPGLGSVKVDADWFFPRCPFCNCHNHRKTRYCAFCGAEPEIPETPLIDWVIAGGESGPGARPAHPDWFRQVRDDCQAAGVPFFFKQWGEWVSLNERAVTWEMEPEFVDAHLKKYRHQGSPCGTDVFYCVGKKAAGAVLDGREWRQMPRVEGLHTE